MSFFVFPIEKIPLITATLITERLKITNYAIEENDRNNLNSWFYDLLKH